MNTDKYRLFNIFWITITIIGCVCIITAGVTWYRKARLITEWKEMFAGLEREFMDLELPPTTESIFTMHREYEWLVKRQEEIWKLLQARNLPVSKPIPLEFKEELLNTEIRLRQLADIQGCQIPKDLGFPKYAGGQIPLTNEVVLLNKQLTVIDEIVNLLLKHKVEEIIFIEWLPYIYYSKEDLYKELTFRIGIQCALEDLLEVLTDLPKTSFFTVVRSIKLDKVDENRVEAELLIGVVELEKI